MICPQIWTFRVQIAKSRKWKYTCRFRTFNNVVSVPKNQEVKTKKKNVGQWNTSLKFVEY